MKKTAIQNNASWSEYVRVRSRYHRSVHLERDARQGSWLDGYVVTPLVRSTLARMGDGLRAERTERAWSLTGPYGSGKSAFALFVANLFKTPVEHAGARRALAKADRHLEHELFGGTGIFTKNHGLLPVLATGERAGLDLILLKALRKAVESHWPATTKMHKQVRAAEERAESGRPVSTRTVVELFEQAAQQVRDRNLATRGLLVIIDEAGKALEYAAQNPTRGDIQLLQELAELASRSGDFPLMLVVSLHQAFDSYASRLSSLQRSEWAKVQGRFADVAFQEASDQILSLIGAALEHPEPLPDVLRSEAKAKADAAVAASRIASADERDRIARLLEACVPLHPTTALALAPLFRTRLAQNERSLFAFLSSQEPGGLQEFLLRPGVPVTEQPYFTLDRLYDYAAAILGPNVSGHQARGWLQIQDALRRLPADAIELDFRLIKTIGLLSVLGDSSGLFASEEFLACALTMGDELGRQMLRASLERLKSGSVVVYRKFKDSHQLWEGSDLNIDDLLQSAIRQLDPTATVVQHLRRVAKPRPLVARRHLFETGTLRYLEVGFADENLLSAVPEKRDQDADGVIWVLVPTTTDAATSVRAKLAPDAEWWGSHGGRPVMVTIPLAPERLRDLSLEAIALERVRAQTPQLAADPVARRELDERISEVHRLVELEVDSVATGHTPAHWLTRDGATKVVSARQLSVLVSDLCAQAFPKAPHVFNELLNRHHLSSAAAAARRELMQGMVERAEQPNLGIEGFPPEMSMYRSLLVAHGLHRQREGSWNISQPAKSEHGLHHAYVEISRFLQENDTKRVNLRRVYDVLRAPPFGMKEGVIPVLVLACAIHRQEEIAIYEDGVFMPAITAPHIERMLRSPEKYELQMTVISGAREKLLDSMVGEDNGTARLLPLVKSVLRTVQDLTAYARNTKSISSKAQAVREALLRAKEPAPLIFEALPQALGLTPVLPKKETELLATLNTELKECLRELRRAYPALLEVVELELFAAVGLPKLAPDVAREQLREWSKALTESCGDIELKGFLIRIGDDVLARDEWLISVATFLGGKPPESWYDSDVDTMKQRLGGLARRLRSSLAVDLPPSGVPHGASLLRIAVAMTGRAEEERIVVLPESEEAAARRFQRQVEGMLEASAADTSREVLLAGLAMVLRDFSQTSSSTLNLES